MKGSLGFLLLEYKFVLCIRHGILWWDFLIFCCPRRYLGKWRYPVNTIPWVSVTYSWKIFGFPIWSSNLHFHFQINIFLTQKRSLLQNFTILLLLCMLKFSDYIFYNVNMIFVEGNVTGCTSSSLKASIQSVTVLSDQVSNSWWPDTHNGFNIPINGSWGMVCSQSHHKIVGSLSLKRMVTVQWSRFWNGIGGGCNRPSTPFCTEGQLLWPTAAIAYRFSSGWKMGLR